MTPSENVQRTGLFSLSLMMRDTALHSVQKGAPVRLDAEFLVVGHGILIVEKFALQPAGR